MVLYEGEVHLHKKQTRSYGIMTVDVITNNNKCFLSSCTLKHFARQKSFLLLRTTLRLGTVPVNNEYHKYEPLFN